jgi:hypothetical protein
VLTSARLRSIKASRSLITELSSSDPTSQAAAAGRQPPPARKIRFQIEAIPRTAAGWNIPGGWSEGMGLVRTASGQVFRVCATAAAVGSETGTGTAVRPEIAEESDDGRVDSLAATAEVNHWRCSGFPLYGQVRIFLPRKVHLARPKVALERICGPAYDDAHTGRDFLRINCLIHVQCCGSGSGSVGSICFWASRIR